MINEEKLFSMLGEILDSQKRMETRLDRMETRQDQMEVRLDNMEARLNNMETTLTRVSVVQENEVLHNIQLLAEAHSTVVEKKAAKSEVEALRENDAFLEGEIRSLSQRVLKLEQAQESA